jgi:hypothetical protein
MIYIVTQQRVKFKIMSIKFIFGNKNLDNIVLSFLSFKKIQINKMDRKLIRIFLMKKALCKFCINLKIDKFLLPLIFIKIKVLVNKMKIHKF